MYIQLLQQFKSINGHFLSHVTIPQKKDWEDVVLPYAKDHGCIAFGAIGTCWGSYMVVRMSSNPLISAGVSMSPSHPAVVKVMKENEKDILDQIQVISILIE